MISPKKAGILVVILVVPALIVLFLYFFGENKFSLEVLENDETQGSLLRYEQMSSPDCPAEPGGHRIPDFRLVDQNGDTVSLATFQGKVLVSNFMFTTCRNICLDMSSQLSRVQSAFQGSSAVVILSHTVDPQTDTPEMLREYAARYGAKSAIWRFLTGDKQTLYNLAKCGYFLPVVETPQDPANPFAHSNLIILVDKSRVIRGTYQGTDREDIDRLITEIKILLKEEQ